MKMTYQTLFIKSPSGNSYNFSAFIEPLHYTVWCLIIVVLVFVPIFIFFIGRNAQESPKITLDGSYEATFVSMIMIGSTVNPIRWSTRIIFIT